jgi:hypothetical protein
MNSATIRTCIYKWGFYPALVLLKEEQENENYQNCVEIKKALDQIMKGREWYLSSKVDDDSISKTYKEIMKGLSNAELIDANMPHYIDEFRKDAFKQY